MTEPRLLLVTKGLDLGGIERIVTDLAVGLSGRGLHVEVALINPDRDRLVATIESGGVAVHRLGGTDRIGPAAGRRLAQLVGGGQFDVVHVHGPLPAVLVRLLARHVAVITTSHTPWGSLRRPTRAGWRLTARRDTAMVAVSAGVAGSLPARLRDDVIVIPHGIDRAAVDRALSSKSTEPAEPDPHAAGCTAIVVASHRDAKNYPNLFQALRVALDSGAEIRLVAVGEGANLATHQRLVQQLGLDRHVTFEPPSEDVLATIATADFLVVASDYEGQPIVVAEALALGKPVVATAVGRVPEMVTPSVGRVVPPRDPAALGAALAELAGNPELRRSMGAAANHQAFGWTLDDVLDAHQTLYARALDSTLP